MSKEVLATAKEKMTKAEESLRRELGQIRAGRANASLLDRIQVEYYGAPTPVNQLASINIPEARVLMITPFDKNSIADIEKAIQMSDIGISPTNDGNVIRLVIPQLTEERRKELAKDVKKEAENSKVAVRNVRRDAMDELKKAQESGNLDDMKAKLEALNEKAQALAVKLYEQAAAAQQAAQGAEGAQSADSSSKGDDVVDGEFTEK